MSWPIDEEDEECGVLEDDYYAFLNVFKDASSDDITNAYRRLSKVYHPDKHTDPVKKKDAEILFNKTKRAYEVLIDPHKRAIYDTLGIKGLETDGWEVVQRTKTPQEIREEYEQLSREREERNLQQRTNPKGTVTVGVDATALFESYDYEDGLFTQLEINSMSISQSIEAPLSINDTVTLHGNIASQNGTGSGNIGCSLRHVISTTTWSECEVGAGNGLYGSVKGFYRISKRCFGTMHGLLQFAPNGIRPGLTTTLSQQLDKHTVGYLTWKAGRLSSSMNTTVVWDSNNGHFVAALQLGLPNTFAMVSYIHRLPDECKVKASAKMGTFGMQVEYGCEIKVTKHSALGASVVAGVPSGVTLKIKINRASQTYIFPLHLSEELLPSAIFYGTVAPLLVWYAVKMLVIQPYRERETKRKAKKAKEANAAKLAEKKKEAAAAVSLMHETYTRNKEIEESKGGLVILKALYGKLIHIERGDDSGNRDAEIVDVTIPLQCLVKDSHLILVEATKSNLPGFYDPCLGEDKHLFILYNFRNLPHSVTVNDLESVRMPKESHLQKS